MSDPPVEAPTRVPETADARSPAVVSAPRSEFSNKPLRESALLVAIITAAVTGSVSFTTMYVGTRLQERSKRVELALLRYKDFVADQTAAVKGVYDAVGDFIGASEDLIRAKSPIFLTNSPQRDRDRLLDHYNTADQRWRASRYSLAFLMSNDGNDDVGQAWLSLTVRVQDFGQCARETYERKAGVSSDATCTAQRAAVEPAYQQLNHALHASRSAQEQLALRGGQ